MSKETVSIKKLLCCHCLDFQQICNFFRKTKNFFVYLNMRTNEKIARTLKFVTSIASNYYMSWFIGVLFTYIVLFWFCRVVSYPFVWAYNLFF